MSRRKAPRGVVFLSVEILEELETKPFSETCPPQSTEKQALFQLIINTESTNAGSSKVYCGCLLRALCTLDAVQKNDAKWGLRSYTIIEYKVISSPRDAADGMGRWKQHPAVEARAGGKKTKKSDSIPSAPPPLCRSIPYVNSNMPSVFFFDPKEMTAGFFSVPQTVVAWAVQRQWRERRYMPEAPCIPRRSRASALRGPCCEERRHAAGRAARRCRRPAPPRRHRKGQKVPLRRGPPPPLLLLSR